MILAAGSIISLFRRSGVVVWGSGIIHSSVLIEKADFRCVRGPRTVKRLQELSIKPPKHYGDPALLTSLIYKPTILRENSVGIIPHLVQQADVKTLETSQNILVIDLSNEVEKVIRQIVGCKLVLSSSLHGLIVAHCYRIPAIWVNFSQNNILSGDDIKFIDYFESVEIKPYKPFLIRSQRDIANIKNVNIDRLPALSIIDELQQSLLRSAPFEIVNFRSVV